jgi:hypothetical protein
MATSPMDALLVGSDFQIGNTIPERLRQLGFQCHFVGSVRAALEELGSHRVDLVLAMECLPDGGGFGLLAAVSGLVTTAFLCLPVERGCVWLPAIYGGQFCWGSRTLRPNEFAQTMQELARRELVASLVFSAGETCGQPLLSNLAEESTHRHSATSK